MFGGDRSKLLVNFGLGPAHDANVELLSGQLLANFKSDSIRAASDYNPRVFFSVSSFKVVSTSKQMALKEAGKRQGGAEYFEGADDSEHAEGDCYFGVLRYQVLYKALH